jgi:hypothetical protein
MNQQELQTKLAQIKQAIANLEGMQAVLSAEQIQSALAPLLQKQAELEAQLSKATYSATVSGEGTVVQGKGNTVVGDRGVNIQGHAQGNIVTGDNNTTFIFGPDTAGEAAALPPELTPLRELLVKYFNLSELHTLAFDLNIASDDLPGSTRSQFAESLITFCYRQNRLPLLLQLCRKQRSFVNWPQLSS